MNKKFPSSGRKTSAELFAAVLDWTKTWIPEGKESIKLVVKTPAGGQMELEQNKKFYDAAMAKKKEGG